MGVWRDYDLAGAYSTGLVGMPLIDFENPRASLDVEDYLGHVAGYALIEFAPRTTPVSRSSPSPAAARA